MIEGLQSFQNIVKVPELKRRVLVTLGLLAAYRLGAHVPTPGIDGGALAEFFDQMQGTLLGMVDLFSGGNLRRLTVFALGIMPYISASIILQLLTVVIPALERLAKEGEAGKKKITQYTRYGTIVLSLVQSFGIAVGLESMRSGSGAVLVPDPGWGFRLLTMLTLTTGTALIMWLGEQISEKGIGNGISLIIFAGIVVRLPSAIVSSYTLLATGELKLFVLLGLLIMMVAVTAAVIVMQEGQRKIPVQYAKRVVGRRMYGGPVHTHPAPNQHRGCDPGHLRLVADPVPGDADPVHPAPVDAVRVGSAVARPVHLHRAVLRADHLLRLLLHGDRLQPGRPRRQHEEIRGIHPRGASGQEDGRVYRSHVDPHHAARRRVPRPHLGAAGLSHPLVQYARSTSAAPAS